MNRAKPCSSATSERATATYRASVAAMGFASGGGFSAASRAASCASVRSDCASWGASTLRLWCEPKRAFTAATLPSSACRPAVTAFTCFTYRVTAACREVPQPARASATARPTARVLSRNSAFEEIDDVGRRCARPEHGRHALTLELFGVVVGDRPAENDEHVLRPVLAQQLEDARHERHVRTGEERDADRVCVLLDRRLDDLLRRLMQARVDDLHAGVAQGTRDDLRATVVPVEAGLGDDDADLAVHATILGKETGHSAGMKV